MVNKKMTRIFSVFEFNFPKLGFLLAFLILTGCSTTTNILEKDSSHIDAPILAHSGIGGTGIQSNKNGVASHLDGGIGGTGSKVAHDGGVGGTGIVGAITRVAKKLRANNIEISYGANMSITVDGKPATIENLLIGQIAVIQAQKISDQVIARNIAVIHAVVGPIEHIDDDDRTLQVLNQTVRVHKEIPITDLETGQWIQVSGYRTGNNTIMATRVDRTRPNATAEIYGNVTQVMTENEFFINDTRVVTEKPIHIAQGAEISVHGQWKNDRLELQYAQLNPTRQNMGQVSDIVVEGFWDTIRGNWEIDLEDYMTNEPNVAESIEQNELVTIYGVLNEAQHIIVNALNIQEIIELEDGYEFDIFDEVLNNHFADGIDDLEDLDSASGADGVFGSTAGEIDVIIYETGSTASEVLNELETLEIIENIDGSSVVPPDVSDTADQLPEMLHDDVEFDMDH